MCEIQLLSLSNNQICDPGITALAEALGNGALPKLEHLILWSNQIGDVGMQALAGAVSKGALPKLNILFIDSPSAELKALCSSKSIKLNTF